MTVRRDVDFLIVDVGRRVKESTSVQVCLDPYDRGRVVVWDSERKRRLGFVSVADIRQVLKELR